MAGRVLVIGRSDCAGEEGIQRDVLTVCALGGTAATVVTSLSARDIDESFEEVELPATFIVRQIDRVVQEQRADVIKIGRLSSEEQVDVVANALVRHHGDQPLVLAPSLFRSDGSLVLSQRALAHWKRRLAHLGTVMVVHPREMMILAGLASESRDDLDHAAMMLATLGCETIVLLAHLEGEEQGLCVLARSDGVEHERVSFSGIEQERQAPEIFAAGVATGLARGVSVSQAIAQVSDHLAGSCRA